MDESIRAKIEPGGAESIKCFAMLKELSKTNASTGLHFMPTVPYLTDNRENVNALYSHAMDCRVSYVLPGVLYLRRKTRLAFFDLIQTDFPALYNPLRDLYKTGGAGKEYKDGLYVIVKKIKKKYGLSGSYSTPIKEKLKQAEYTQQSLFN